MRGRASGPERGRRPAPPQLRLRDGKLFLAGGSALPEFAESLIFSYARRHLMARFVADLVRRHPPTALTVFYNGAAPRQAARAARYRAGARARRDLLWRDVSRYPDALSLFGLGRSAACAGLAVVDRHGRLRLGLDARVALWRELPRYRWRSLVLDCLGIAALLERPVTPRTARATARRARSAPLTPRRPASPQPLA